MSIETVRMASNPNLLFVLIHTDADLTGLGETYFGAEAVESYIHESAASQLLGADPAQIEAHSAALTSYVGYAGSGAETRGNSALDVALWDLWGQSTGQPLHQLLGGRVRDDIRTYNTCAGSDYVRQHPRQESSNWGVPTTKPAGLYEDLAAFLTDAGALAQDLMSEGITAMKIWPFDFAAERSGGQDISTDELATALRPLESIREAVGNSMDVAVELHSHWNLPTAKKILRALGPLTPMWVEDPIRGDNPTALAELAASTSVPIAVGESLAGRNAFRALFDASAVDVPIADISWVGGLTEARAIATLADSYRLPFAAHDCTGPVVLAASTHLALHLRNAYIQESVRAYYTGWYQDLVTDIPKVSGGRITPPPGPGLGLRLQPDLLHRPGVRTRVSALGGTVS